MPTVKRLVCLANSRRPSGYCVAGKRMINGRAGRWVRPVSGRPSEGVSARESQYPDGTVPRVLDLMGVPLLEPKPKAYQTENWVIAPKSPWEFAGRITWNQLKTMTDSPTVLWINTSSTRSGLNDRVSLSDAAGLNGSLYLLQLPKLTLQVFAPGALFNNPRRRVQAGFHYNGVEYRLKVTDPEIEEEYRGRPDGSYAVNACCVTVSLGEPHQDGFCYKLVAALVTPDRARSRAV